MGIDVSHAALAGLLHDIGKFAQRARERATRIWDAQAERDFRYEHALLSGDFVDRYVPMVFRPLTAPANHHAPQSELDRIVQLADRLSAREREVDRARHPKRLLSVFCRVHVDEGGRTLEAPAGRFHALAPLALDHQQLFPAETAEGADVTREYEALWNGTGRAWPGFATEAAVLRDIHEQSGDAETYLESLLLLMQRYLWCIPAAYYGTKPDVSLYDHSRTTAALSACLAAHSDEQVQRWLQGQDQTGPAVALLVGGDLSGIQKFIYTISSRGAASALRGRSMYLQLLVEAIARYVLRELGLPITNLIQCSGGHFYLLARHNDSAKLAEIRQKVSRILVAHHGGELYLALEAVPLTPDNFAGEALPRRWSDLGEVLRQAKTRKFSELGADLQALVFAPRRDQGNEKKACQVCGREHPGTPDEKDTSKPRKCPQCLGFEALGKDLRAALYLRLSAIDPSPLDSRAVPGTWDSVLAHFGCVAALEPEGQVSPALSGARRSVILALRDEALLTLRPDVRTAVGRRFLVNVTPVIADAAELDRLRNEPGVRDLPADPGAVKPFEALEAEAVGIRRLGVLRMDVDDMGHIIREGLGDAGTLSRLSTLSSMVSLFFEGWTAQVAAGYNRAGGATTDRVYSIYSGGDDLFFVGAWDAMPELALQIRNDLQEYVAGHLGIHASAGVVLVSGRYPLYQAADDALAALEAAKARPGKNAISFLGQTVAWPKFAEDDGVKALADRLREMVERKHVPKSLLGRLYQLYRLYAEVEKESLDRGQAENVTGESQVYWGPWHWRAAYYLTRMAKQNHAAEGDIMRLHGKLSGDNFRAIEWIGLAARWADLSTRRISRRTR